MTGKGWFSPDDISSISISKSLLLPGSAEGLEDLLVAFSGKLGALSLSSESRSGGAVLSQDPVRVSHCVEIDNRRKSHPESV
jgi:hypothetical protein